MLAPNRKPYQTHEGNVCVCVLVYNDAQWKAFLALVCGPDLCTQDARFTAQTARIAHIHELYG